MGTICYIRHCGGDGAPRAVWGCGSGSLRRAQTTTTAPGPRALTPPRRFFWAADLDPPPPLFFLSLSHFQGVEKIREEDLPFEKEHAAALANVNPDFPGSCGRCYEV